MRGWPSAARRLGATSPRRGSCRCTHCCRRPDCRSALGVTTHRTQLGDGGRDHDPLRARETARDDLLRLPEGAGCYRDHCVVKSFSAFARVVHGGLARGERDARGRRIACHECRARSNGRITCHVTSCKFGTSHTNACTRMCKIPNPGMHATARYLSRRPLLSLLSQALVTLKRPTGL